MEGRESESECTCTLRKDKEDVQMKKIQERNRGRLEGGRVEVSLKRMENMS